MPIPEIALTGTELLTLDRHTAFSDRYHKQYAQTLAWLQGALRDQAEQRTKMQAGMLVEGPLKQAEVRLLLAELTGASQLQEAQSVSTLEHSDAGSASFYTLTTPSGLIFTGQVIDPPTAQPRGLVISNRQGEWVKAYLAQGLRVVIPFLAEERHSFAGDPEGHWYHFNDAEFLHLFFFITGGALCGLEATELNTLSAHFRRHNDLLLPVALDLEERQTLAATVAAALAPDLPQGLRPQYQLLVLDKAAQLLDHQEADVRVNMIWRFHAHFDALTLFNLAAPAGLLFIEASPTPSLPYSQAHTCFAEVNHPQISVPVVSKLVTPSAQQLAAAVARRLTGSELVERQEPQAIAINIRPQSGESHYLSALESKLAFLKKLHLQAAQRRKARYDITGLTAEEYRQRVAESILHVAGSPLPESPERHPRTRLVKSEPAYDLYEVVLQGVSAVETAGYLMLPKRADPRPAVICQHGLGGRPEILAGLNNELEGGWVYDRFAQRLVEKGYVVYAPFMNWGHAPTSSRDTLVKHAYALGFAPNRFEVAQLHAIVDFLQSRPEVIPNRIAFYGLSYGGHASVWLCAQEPRLCAVVTAGHFNDWHRKLTTLELSPPLVRPTSYISVDEGYDMFNYDVLNHLCHPQLVTRYAPRPYMVENGLQDAVSPTAWVDQEFATVQTIYDWLGASDQTELEHFAAGHRIWAENSFRFLHRHLNPVETKESQSLLNPTSSDAREKL